MTLPRETLLSEVTDDTELSVRPQRLDDYRGQDPVVKQLQISIKACLGRQEALDHTLIMGPPGLGKTTLARIIANELGTAFHQTSAPAIEKAGDLAALLTNAGPRDVIFIDEIHRLSKPLEETLYSAMEDFAYDIMIGEGPHARSVRLDLAPFTLIGATTRAGVLSAPLRDRFGICHRLDFYDDVTLQAIVKRSATILNVGIADSGALAIACRARGTPRIANRLLRRVRDYAEVQHQGMITETIAQEALTLLKIDQTGLDDLDRKYLIALIKRFSGGPVGLDTLSASLIENKQTLEDIIEPYLMTKGFIERTARGRQATPKAHQWMKGMDLKH